MNFKNMKTIKILFPYSAGPDVSSFYSIFFDNVLPELKKKVNVKVIWLVYQPEKNIITKSYDDVKIIYIQDYSDAFTVLKKEAPDILFSFPWPDFIAYAFALAAKSLKIPTFSIIFSHTYQERTYQQTLQSYFTRFFEKSVPTDSTKENKQFMRRGRFFLKKYLFLMKTQKSLGFRFTKIISDFFMLIKLLLTETQGTIDPRFATKIHFAVGENLINSYTEKGFSRSSIILTGNPTYDSTFKKFFQKQTSESKIIRILFAPSTQYESGFWTKQQRDHVFKSIVQILSNQENISLIVKIHPSTARLSEYQELINSVNKSVKLVQKGDLRDFLENVDVYISSEISTGEFFAVIAKIPIIICRFFEDSDENILVKHNVAKLCKNPENLLKIINSVKTNPILELDRQKFIQSFLYKDDGCASERIASELIKLVNEKK